MHASQSFPENFAGTVGIYGPDGIRDSYGVEKFRNVFALSLADALVGFGIDVVSETYVDRAGEYDAPGSGPLSGFKNILSPLDVVSAETFPGGIGIWVPSQVDNCIHSLERLHEFI